MIRKSIIIPKIDFVSLTTPEIEKKAIEDISNYIKKTNINTYRLEQKRPTKINSNVPKLDFSIL